MLYFSLIIITIILMPLLHWYKYLRTKKLLCLKGKIIHVFYPTSRVLFLNFLLVIGFLVFICLPVVILIVNPDDDKAGFVWFFLGYFMFILYYANAILKEMIVIDQTIYYFSLWRRCVFTITEITTAKRLINTAYQRVAHLGELNKDSINAYNKERLLLSTKKYKNLSLGYFAENYDAMVSYLRKQNVRYEQSYSGWLRRF